MNLLDIVYLYTINFSSALKIDKLKAKRVLKITLLFIHVIFRKAQQIASGCRGGSLFPLHPQMILPRSVTPTAWLASAGLFDLLMRKKQKRSSFYIVLSLGSWLCNRCRNRETANSQQSPINSSKDISSIIAQYRLEPCVETSARTEAFLRTDRPTNKQTDMSVYRYVTLSIRLRC